MKFNELNNEQRRQTIDLIHTFETLEQANDSLKHSYSGSMRWLSRKGHDYLHLKKRHVEKSLGLRSEETEKIYDFFQSGRKKTKHSIDSLTQRLESMAPVNRALLLGRVPKLTSRILRKLAQENILGEQLLVVGTNALWAYEAKAGVQLTSDLLATTDADLLMDARKHMSLLTPEARKGGIIGILQKIDSSFKIRGERDFKAVNKDGFSVDLIQPEDYAAQMKGTVRKTLGDKESDLHGAPIFGLHWLLNAPKFSAIVVGEDGLPLRITTIDPRAFALHKLWISSKPMRDPLKRPRDRSQAEAVAQITRKYFGLEFDAKDLNALPIKLKNLITA